jgi:hypothetical protein
MLVRAQLRDFFPLREVGPTAKVDLYLKLSRIDAIHQICAIR